MKTRHIFVFLLLSLAFQVHITAQRNVRSLNGEWRFCVDSLEKGIPSFAKGLPSNAVKVQVPHAWNVMEGLEEYSGLAWYEHTFDLSPADKGKDIRLKFHAVYRDAVIYLNGKKIGQHFSSGYTTFYIPINQAAKYGKENKLVVSVSNAYSSLAIPIDTSFDWNNDGGIIRSVDLIVTDKPAIRYVHVNTQNSGQVGLQIKLWDQPNKNFTYKAVVKERISGKEIVTITKDISREQTSDLAMQINNPSLWHFDHPFLYDLEVSTLINGKAMDTYKTHFGFREIKVEGEKMYLNGEAVRLIGVEWMPGSNPDYGMAEPKEFIDDILRDMKEVNCVVTRFHWQQDEYILDKMDEMGILLQEEIPWWQRPGNLTPETNRIIQDQLSEMIESHYNHPCIFSWAISNEVTSNTKPQQYVDLISYARKLDPNRLIQVVSNEMPFRKEKDESLLGDVPTWNEYIGTWHGKSREEVGHYFQVVKDIVGNRPIMITEHGLCEPRFTGGDARRIDEMHFHLREWAKHDWVVVAIYFSLNDYRTHMGEEGSGKYKRRTHGITGMYRERKPSFYSLKELSSPVEVLNIYQKDDKNVVSLKNKGSLPSYTIRDYKLVAGNKTILLPTLEPGESADIELPHGTKVFTIERPTGFTVMTHVIQP